MSAIAGRLGSGSGTRASLDRIVEELTNAIQGGEPVSLEAFVARYPEHADAIGQLIPALEVLADLGHSAARGPSLGPFPSGGLGELGDYRIVREVGRGGMGVVYEAWQISLNRRVALKVLAFAAALDPRQLRRFLSEAQAAAGLHHTNIVPVYAVGCERGVHYYAMQFIEGQSLAEVIRQRRRLERSRPEEYNTGEMSKPTPAEPTRSSSFEHTPKRPDSLTEATRLALSSGPSTQSREFIAAVARLGEQAAEALEYAHVLGVIHRDIKPANLMVDARGNLWITDFGLARLTGDSGLTITGDLIGTLRYMSPEQARGGRVVLDHRTDVYSLGVTLYELLTLRPAVNSDDRAQVLRQITFEEPPSLRKLNSSIPRDLETIVLKAMAKEPERRYTTAQDLADDLHRFLERKPILARRPSLLERAIKWVQRHLTVVVAATMLLLVAVVGLSIALVLIARERTRAEARYRVARRAVDEMYTRVAEQWLAQQPRLEPLQRELLNHARDFYEDFARESGSDPAIQYEAARASDRVGRIEARLGHPREAEPGYRRAIAILERLAAGYPRRKEPRSELANVYSHLGLLLESMGRHAEAESAYGRSVKAHEALAHEFPDDPEILAGLVANLVNRSRRQSLSGRLGEAEESLRKAVDIQRKQAALRPHEAYAQSALGAGLSNLAQTILDRNDPDSALNLVVEAQRHQQDALRLKPGDPTARTFLRTHYLVEANAWKVKGDLPRAAEAFRQTIAQDEALISDFPSVPRHRNDLANDNDELAAVLKTAGQSDAAERALRRALEVSDRLVADYPDQPLFLDDSAIILSNFASLLAGQGHPDEAEAIRRRVVVRMERLVGRFPKRADLRSRLGAALFNLAESCKARDATPEARHLLERAVSLVESALRDNPSEPDGRRIIGRLREALAAMPSTSAGRSDGTKDPPEEATAPKPR